MIANDLLVGIKPLHEWLDGTEAILKDRGGCPKYPLTSLPEFSDMIWGLHKGMTVIGARSSMGKSAFAVQIARDMADAHIPTLLLSLEMDVESIIERLFCQMMKVDNFDMICGKLNTDDEIKLKWQTFRFWINKVPLMITNGLGKTFKDVNTIIDLLDPKPRVVIIDYIQGIRQGEKERAELNEYIRNFRQLMIQNNMVGILASQMNRMTTANDDKRPALENLKSTGVLEEHADVVFMLHWDYFYTRKEEDKNRYEIIVGKNRNGRTGKHDLWFIPEFYLFVEKGTNL